MRSSADEFSCHSQVSFNKDREGLRFKPHSRKARSTCNALEGVLKTQIHHKSSKRSSY